MRIVALDREPKVVRAIVQTLRGRNFAKPPVVLGLVLEVDPR